MRSQPDKSQLDAYMDKLVLWLDVIPPDEREDVGREIRQHIEWLITEHEMRGLAYDAAVTAALEQFGRSYQVGPQLASTWLKEHKTTYLQERIKKSAAEKSPERKREERRYAILDHIWTFLGIFLLFFRFSERSWVESLLLATFIGLVAGLLQANTADKLPDAAAIPAMTPEVRAETLIALQEPNRWRLPENPSLGVRFNHMIYLWICAWSLKSLQKGESAPVDRLWVGVRVAAVFTSIVVAVTLIVPMEDHLRKGAMIGCILAISTALRIYVKSQTAALHLRYQMRAQASFTIAR